MKTITLNGWKVGFDKVGLNRLLRDQFGFSLGDAKSAVDTIVENKEIKLSVSDEGLISIHEKLTALCIIFTVS
jgi:hypothetical protein